MARKISTISKKSFKRILVPLDGSKNSFRALKESVNLAKFTNSQIVGIYVIPEDISSLPLIELLEPLSSIHPSGFQKKIFKFAQRIIEDAKEICAKNRIKFSGQILEGNPGYDIVQFAKSGKNRIDLIVIGSRGKSPTKEIFLGSVSSYVVQKSKCPVMIVK